MKNLRASLFSFSAYNGDVLSIVEYVWFTLPGHFKGVGEWRKMKKKKKVSICLHYIAKSIGSPPSNERYDYFSNSHEYKS